MLHDAAAAAAPPLPPDRDEGGRHVLRGSIMGNKVGATGTAARAALYVGPPHPAPGVKPRGRNFGPAWELQLL